MPGKWGPNSHSLDYAPTDDREQFIRDNAVAIVRQLEAKSARQRRALTALNKTVANLRRELKRARGAEGG